MIKLTTQIQEVLEKLNKEKFSLIKIQLTETLRQWVIVLVLVRPLQDISHLKNNSSKLFNQMQIKYNKIHSTNVKEVRVLDVLECDQEHQIQIL